MKYFNFHHALNLVKSGFTVGLDINGKSRTYHKDDHGNIVCETGNTSYVVKCWYVDAVESKDWYMV